jgi:hypothetical protein
MRKYSAAGDVFLHFDKTTPRERQLSKQNESKDADVASARSGNISDPVAPPPSSAHEDVLLQTMRSEALNPQLETEAMLDSKSSYFDKVLDDREIDDIALINASGLFDEEFYLNYYPDVRSNGYSGIAHYMNYGACELRIPSQFFDPVAYMSNNDDITSANANPIVHYLRYGRTNGRSPIVATQHSTFHEDGYTLDVPPYIDRDYAVILHSGLFDEEYYLRHNIDVASAGIMPLVHFCKYGWRELRRPRTDFNPAYYLEKYPDVANSNINPFVHWIVYGKQERRKIDLVEVPVHSKDSVNSPSVIFISHEASRTGAPAVLMALMRWLKVYSTYIGNGGNRRRFPRIDKNVLRQPREGCLLQYNYIWYIRRTSEVSKL